MRPDSDWIDGDVASKTGGSTFFDRASKHAERLYLHESGESRVKELIG